MGEETQYAQEQNEVLAEIVDCERAVNAFESDLKAGREMTDEETRRLTVIRERLTVLRARMVRLMRAQAFPPEAIAENLRMTLEQVAEVGDLETI